MFDAKKKTGIREKESCLVYMYTKFQREVLKNDLILTFKVKNGHYPCYFPGFPYCFLFLSLTRFGSFKNGSMLIFRVLDEK